MKYQITQAPCNCGAVKVSQRTVGGILKGNVRCHCSTCRKQFNPGSSFNGKFGTQVPDWCCNVKVEGETEGSFAYGKCTYGTLCCPNGICTYRTTCKNCKQDIVGWAMGVGTGLAIVNAQVMNRAIDTGPKFNIYYNSGLKEGQNGLKTYYDDCPSYFGLLLETAKALPFAGATNCCCIDPPKTVSPLM